MSISKYASGANNAERDYSAEVQTADDGKRAQTEAGATFRIGWAQADITPEETVVLAGLIHVRLSEGIADPLTATALVLDSGTEQVLWVGCDLIHISENLLAAVRTNMAVHAPEIDTAKLVMHATHTHTAPPTWKGVSSAACAPGGESGLDLPAMTADAYTAYAAERIARAIGEAWSSRLPGGISYGEGTAVIGHNRRWVNADGVATMYRTGAQNFQRANAQNAEPLADHSHYSLSDSDAAVFSHVEGGEDHQIQFMATYNTERQLTGLLVNVPCPAQEEEEGFRVSADWWHETRIELRRRFGDHLYILPQCGAAGDLSPHRLYGAESRQRMLKMKGITVRQDIAIKIADAAADVLPWLPQAIEWNPPLVHRMETVTLTMNRLTEEIAQTARQELEKWQAKWEQELRRLEADPAGRQRPRWYLEASYAFTMMHWQRNVLTRYEQQGECPVQTIEMHALRIGQAAFVTQPFECYLDLGLQIRLRSPAVQTFLVQLSGRGTYLPSLRSVQGGGYGSTATSNPVGPEGARELVEQSVQALNRCFAGDKP